MTNTSPFAIPSYASIYEEYDRQRRLRLVMRIIPPFLALNSLAVGAFFTFALLSPSLRTLGFAASGIVFALDVCFLVAWLAGRSEHVDIATNLTIFGILVVIISIETAWITIRGRLSPYGLSIYTAFGIVIVLAGVVGEVRTVVISAVLLNIYSIALLNFVHVPGLAPGELLPIMSGTFIYQWAFAGLMIAMRTSYRQTLQELSNIRYAVEQARKLDDLKDQFISSINHELRNPIMALQGFLESLQMAVRQNMPNATLERLANRANFVSDNLRTLVQSILEVRRIDQIDQFNFQPVDILTAASDAANLLDPREGQMVERELRLQIVKELHVWADPIRLQQILINLLSNALKYSAPGTPIELHGSVVIEHGSKKPRQDHSQDIPMVEIAVRDFGLGIPLDEAPLLFNRFVRLPRDLASSTTGNGLGLFLCRVLSQAMGGSIRVESSGVPGEGSTFIVRLPSPPLTHLYSEDTGGLPEHGNEV